jgi:pimeloyl-ACP methyl ester carboxylesterase
MTREGLRQGIAGGLADLEIFSQPWNVDFAAIQASCVLWQGTADRIVPVEAALWLGKQLPHCSIELIEGAGHFWIYEHVDACLARVSQLAATDGQKWISQP